MSQLKENQDQSCRILWMYPDVLHLHGDRGNLMALERVARLLGLEPQLRRQDQLQPPVDLEWADILVFSAGELRRAAPVISALIGAKEELDQYVAAGKMILACGSSGAILARETQRLDGGCFRGLGLLDMVCREREQIWGDDLWFTLEDGTEVMGSQIQVVDTTLGPGQAALGQVGYGRGNDGGGGEGAVSGNVVFTNCLGPVLVKNPRFTALCLSRALAARGVVLSPALTPEQTRLEDQSYALIRAFIQQKQAKAGGRGRPTT